MALVRVMPREAQKVPARICAFHVCRLSHCLYHIPLPAWRVGVRTVPHRFINPRLVSPKSSSPDVKMSTAAIARRGVFCNHTF